MANTTMMFPNTVREFMEQYKMVDTEQIYSNGTEYVPIFRMEQWFAHQSDIPRWIPVTERLPEEEGQYLVCCNGNYPIEVGGFYIDEDGERYFCCDWNDPDDIEAWMPLPEPYKRGEWKNEKNDRSRNM